MSVPTFQPIPPTPPSPTRRRLLHISPLLLLPILTPSSPASPTPASLAAAYIRDNCLPLLSHLRPLSRTSLLYRGSTLTSSAAYALRSPAPDLLSPHTYGPQGAAFFAALSDSPVPPASAHIATGDPQEAARWGQPVSVWPVGDFTYAYRERGQLIYEHGETVRQAHQRRGPLVQGQLRPALEQGKEVMFQCPSFLEVGDDLLEHVLIQLDPDPHA